MSNEKSEGFAFGKLNYRIMIVGVVISVIGFILMTGGGSEDPTKFDASEIFSARRITVAPILVLLGYVVVLYSIFKKSPKAE